MKAFITGRSKLHVRMGALTVTSYICLIATAIVTMCMTQRALASGPPILQIVSGNNQQASYMSAFQMPLVVGAMDALSHRVLAGVRVRFQASPEVELSSQFVDTDSHGLASVSANGSVLGKFTVKAEIVGDSESTVIFDHLSVEKAKLVIVPADMQSIVGQVPTIASYSIRGFVNGETIDSAHITGTPELTTTARVTSPEANYAIKGGVGSLSAPNYDFVAGFGVLVVSGGAGAPRAQSDPDASYIQIADDNEKVVRLTIVNEAAAASPSSMILAGGDRDGSELHVQPVGELSRPVQTVSFASSEAVKVVRTLNQPRILPVAGNTGSVHLANMTMPTMTPSTSSDRNPSTAAVRSASLLKVENASVTLKIASSSAVVQKAFPPNAR